MPDPEDLSFSLDDFTGTARLFPLPDLVLFPNVMQPLHVFEPRYREMLEEALDGDRLIAMAVLASQENYHGRPPIHSAACLARVTSHQRLDDGKYNLLVLGLRRIRVVRELPPLKSFREAEVELREDVYPSVGSGLRPKLRRKLVERFRTFLPGKSEARSHLEELLRDEVPLGVLTDIVGYTLELEAPFKLKLLGEPNVDRRATWLIEKLADLEPAEPASGATLEFPPRFSVN